MTRDQRHKVGLIDVLDRLKKDIFTSLNSCRIGTITSFDPATQTAQISIVDKRVIETDVGDGGEVYRDYAVLEECPIYVPKGTAGGFTYPISPGDGCIVLFNDRDYSLWLASGGVQAPDTKRTHDFSDAIAVVGLRNLTNALPFNNLATEMNFGNTIISLDDKVKLANDVHSLKTLMEELIDELINAIVTGAVFSPATKVALEAVKVKFNNLLKA